MRESTFLKEDCFHLILWCRKKLSNLRFSFANSAKELETVNFINSMPTSGTIIKHEENSRYGKHSRNPHKNRNRIYKICPWICTVYLGQIISFHKK